MDLHRRWKIGGKWLDVVGRPVSLGCRDGTSERLSRVGWPRWKLSARSTRTGGGTSLKSLKRGRLAARLISWLWPITWRSINVPPPLSIHYANYTTAAKGRVDDELKRTPVARYYSRRWRFFLFFFSKSPIRGDRSAERSDNRREETPRRVQWGYCLRAAGMEGSVTV